jgi:phytoene synthase
MKSTFPEVQSLYINNKSHKNKGRDSQMNDEQWLSFCHKQVHRLDRDRLMCAMVANQEKRGSLLALLAFNLEIATIPELVSEPMLGEIRLQWWRDTLDDLYAGNPVAHPVAQGLVATIEKAGLSKSLFDGYLDARAFDLKGQAPASLMELENYAEGTAGALHELMAEALGVAALAADRQQRVRAAARHSGVAWALSGLLGARDFHARQGRSYFPTDLEDAEKAIAEAAGRHIAEARNARQDMPKSMLPVMLPVVLAEHALRKLSSTSEQHPGARRLFGFYWKVLTNSY